MKKVKTILASLLIMLATAFMSACSCSGDDTSNLPQVPVNTISITSDFEGAVRDEETGFLKINCIYGEEFNITYKLGPDNTTRTQVDWDFEERDDVVATKSNYYTYSQGTSHTVRFVTKTPGTTIIKFKPRGTDKWTQATVQVSTPKASWPTFVAPTGLNYNPNTGKVTWNPVEKMKTGSTIVDVEKNNGQIVGLTGYLVNYKNLTTGEEYSTPSDNPIAKCEYELPRGYSYIINVIAKGNNFSHSDSPASENFKFHQLAEPTELSNNNGEISFKTAEFADTNEIYYNANDTSKFITIPSSGAQNCKFFANEKFASLTEYNVSIVSYPKNYAQAKLEGKNYVLDESTGIRYYASIKTEKPLTIQNLVAPTITMSSKQGVETISGLTFGLEGSDNNPYLCSTLNWEIEGKTYSQDYGVQFAYAIYKGDTKIMPSGDGYKITQIQTLDLEDLRQNSGEGSYRIEIFACGNSANTISSKVTTLAFNIQGAMDMANTSIVDNKTLETSTAYSTLYGIELYFLNKTTGSYNQENSLYKFFDGKSQGTLTYSQKSLSVNLAHLELTPGLYDVYGRFVGIHSGVGSNELSVTSKLAKINTNDLVVASAVTGASLSSEGILTFNPISDANDYILNFTQKKSGIITRTFEERISSDDYTINDDKVTLSVYDIIGRYLLDNDDNVDDINLSEKVGEFTSDCEISFTITTVGKDQDGINSKPTASIKFERHKMVNVDTIKLNNYKLSFTSENDAKYIVSFGDTQITTEKKKGNIEIELGSFNRSEPIDITIWAIGSQATTSSKGFINSFAQTKSFACTEVPDGLEMQEDGTLLWNLRNDFTNAQNFTLRFYTNNGSEWQLAKTLSVSGVARMTSEEEGVLGKYSHNVTEVIDEIGSDKTIAITVQHTMTDRFSNVESEKYYAVKLSSVELSYAMYEEAPAITFDTLNTSGLTYTLSITKDENEPIILPYTELNSSTTCIKSIRDNLSITDKGNYTLSLYASSTTTGTNAETNPFVLSSTSNTLTIKIISSQIQAFADGELVKWKSIHDDATYKLAYKVNGGSDYVEVAETFTKDNCEYNLWQILASGTNKVKVIPSIDYETTGCILSADSAIECDIVKLDTVSDISTSNGKLTYTLSEELTDYSLIVYAHGAKLSSDSYIIDYANKEITILSSTLVGSKSYALQIVQKEKVDAETGEVLITGKINSNLSTAYTATKIEAVSDLTKIGEWIQFTPVDNAEIYELTFKMVGGSDVVSKQIKFDGTKVYVATIGEDNSITWTEDVSLAKFENSLIQVKFTNEFLGTDAVAGDYTYTITPYTSISSYLNGNTSSPLTITKLSNAITIGVENESITLSSYQPAGSNAPISIAYEISRYEIETTTVGEGEEEREVQNKVIKSTKSGTLTYAGDVETSVTSDVYKLNLNDLGIYVTGNYQISLMFVGDGNAIISSERITDDTFIKLSSSALSTQNGILSWSKTDSATSYTLKIACDVTGSEEETNTTNEWLFDITPADLENPQVTEAELIAIDETFKFEMGKTYKVQVMSNGAGMLSSTWSNEFEVKKLQAPTNIAISATNGNFTYVDNSDPENPQSISVKIGDPMLTWSDPNGVIYRLNYVYNLTNEQGEGEDVTIFNTASDSSELLGQLLPTNVVPGKYQIRMKTIGNTTSGTNKIGLLTSDYSSSDISPNATYVNESDRVGFGVSDEATTFGTFDWNKVQGAYGYKLTFFEGMNSLTGTKVYTTYTTSNTYTFRNSEFTGAGYYTVLVNAITDPSQAIVSTYTTGEETTPLNISSLYKAPNVSNLMVKDGMFAWGLKIEDIRTFLEPHASIENDTLIDKFGIDKSLTASAKQTALLSSTIDYISKKINNKADAISEVDKIISTLYNFKGTINGYEQTIAPTSVDVIRIGTGSDGKPTYNTVGSNYQDTDLLMFSFDITTATIEIGENAYSTSKYTLNVVPQGNYTSSNSTGLISSVDGAYIGVGQTAYKPSTPKSWSDAENSTQISDGKLLWSLVTTEDSTAENFEYHENYKITAINANNIETKVSRNINISSTEVIVDEVPTNPNLKDSCNYFRNLKDSDMFGSVDISTNTNYNLEISVIGTKDSTILGSDEKAYLNSNVFSYTEPMNILENHESSISGGEYRWTPCTSMSTATRVVVYGPFTDESGEPIYAPNSTEESTWVVKGTTYASYELALSAWKNAILDTWTIITKADDECTNQELTLKNKLRHEYVFGEESDSSGESVTVTRQSTFNLTGKEEYLAGSYIFRKQEIGNGKGIIDTEFSETLINADTTIPNFAYEQIGTKLGMTSTSATTIAGEDIWIKDGKFVWKEVPRANAYRIYLEKIDTSTGLEVGNYRETVFTNSFEMPERQEFNDVPSDSGASYQYRITIVATHIESDGYHSANYFDGENVQTDSYGRAPIPTSLVIDENGVISWNEGTFSGSVLGYEVRINTNNSSNYATTSDKKYDLSAVSSNGTFNFSVRACGIETFLNSCFTPQISITKLPKPDVKIENGVLVWGTESSSEIGEQPTKTLFTLNGGDVQELDIKTGSYPLHTEITSFDFDYLAENEQYGVGNYTYTIKYQGTSGQVSDTQTNFTIASSTEELTATKLAVVPKPENVDVQSGGVYENRIRWNAVENAQGYRALVITQITNSAGNKEDVIFDRTFILGSTSEYFVQNADSTFDLRINKVLEALGITGTQGISLNVYVQAIGTLDSTLTSDRFVSGSFSNIKVVEIPSNANNLTFDSSTGILTWGFVDEATESKGHNIQLTTEYDVTNVSEKDFIDYWMTTSNYIVQKGQSGGGINGHPTDRPSEIQYRSIEFTYTTTIDEETIKTYSLHVVDTILLVGEKNQTPTSYQLTNIGTNYVFKIIVMVGKGESLGFKSDVSVLDKINGNPIKFNLFEFGDGSALLPYGVNNTSRLDSIRYFLDRHFVITNDITFKDTKGINAWNMIDGTFTGSIDGNGYTISYMQPSEIIIENGNEWQITKAIMRENAGVIKNLNISVNSQLSGNTLNSKVEVAGLVITNSGTIDGVNLTTIDGGSISVSYSNTLYTTRVAGMAVYNNGTISNSSVVVNKIEALDSNTDDYNISTKVAGIASINTGTISNTYFDGNIKGNYVSGITNENSGNISNCYALGIAYATDADASAVSDGGKGIQFGGIAGAMSGTATIENCYSRMIISIDIKTSNSILPAVGGLVGYIASNSNVTIKNSYVLFRAEITGNAGNVTTSENMNTVVAPKNNNATYSNNYYLVETITGSTNLTAYNADGVAKNAVSIEGLVTEMTGPETEIKDDENNLIYTVTIGTNTSKYPLLISNLEKNPEKK